MLISEQQRQENKHNLCIVASGFESENGCCCVPCADRLRLSRDLGWDNVQLQVIQTTKGNAKYIIHFCYSKQSYSVTNCKLHASQ